MLLEELQGRVVEKALPMNPQGKAALLRPPLLPLGVLVVLNTPVYGQRVFRVEKANAARVVLEMLSEREHALLAGTEEARRQVAEARVCLDGGMAELAKAAAYAQQSWLRRLLARCGGGGG